MKLRHFFQPRGIAVIGASSNVTKVGYQIVNNLSQGAYRHKVFLINLKGGYLKTQNTQLRYKVFIRIEDLLIDYWAQLLVVIAIPAPLVAQELKKCAVLGIKNFIIISAGFKESGANGISLENDLAAIIEEHDLQVLGPNCLGLINNIANFNASFSKNTTQAGSLALISQSGAIGSAALDWLNQQKLKLSYFISLGNKSFLNEIDFLEYLAHDSKTKAIVLYLEEINQGLELIKLSTKIIKTKPIVLLMSGLDKASQAIIKSHTGALAGDKRIIATGLEAGGIVQIDNLQDIFSLFPILSNWEKYQIKLTQVNTKSVNILTNAGGLAALSADIAANYGIKIKNSFDILGNAGPDDYQQALRKILDSDPKTSVLILLSPQANTQVSLVAQELLKLSKLSKYKNNLLLASFMGGAESSLANKYLLSNSFIAFNFPEITIKILAYLFKYQRFSIKNFPKLPEIKKINLNSKKTVAMDYLQSFTLLKKYKIPVVSTKKLTNLNNLTAKNFPAVLKITGSDFVHKTDKQAIYLNIKNKTELSSVISHLQKIYPQQVFLAQNKINDNYLVLQKQADSKLELILGLKRDSSFGPILLLGLGGIYSEVFKKTRLSLANLNKTEAKTFIKSLDLYPILAGARGARSYNLDKLADILVNLSKLAQANPQIQELDINPLFVQDNDYLAVDVRIFID